MTTKLRLVFLTLLLMFFQGLSLAQNSGAKSDAPKTDDDEFANKKPETKITEVVPTDSVASSELLKRAVNWIKVESLRYKKLSGTTASSKAECTASFPVKPKQLNPEVDYTGKITMKVVIDCKDSKYKYTVSDIRHVSRNGRTTGGSIDNLIPECGSIGMNEIVWKKLKGEALKCAALVVMDLREGMGKLPANVPSEEW